MSKQGSRVSGIWRNKTKEIWSKNWSLLLHIWRASGVKFLQFGITLYVRRKISGLLWCLLVLKHASGQQKKWSLHGWLRFSKLIQNQVAIAKWGSCVLRKYSMFSERCCKSVTKPPFLWLIQTSFCCCQDKLWPRPSNSHTGCLKKTTSDQRLLVWGLEACQSGLIYFNQS